MRKGILATVQKTALGLLVAGLVILAFHGISSALTLTISDVLTSTKGFVAPAGITTDAANVFVADYGAKKIYKVDGSKNVTTLVDFTALTYKPVSVAYYSSKIYALVETADGLGNKVYVYNSTTGVQTTPNPFGSTITKGSDIAVDSANGYVYVTDVDAAVVRVFDASGVAQADLGAPYPVNIATTDYGNSKFYIPSGLWIDTTNSRLLVADYGNITPAYTNKTIYRPRFNDYFAASIIYGKPKGKIQRFSKSGNAYATLVNMFGPHGTSPADGQTLSVTGICTNATYTFVLDSFGKKIFAYTSTISDTPTAKDIFATQPSANTIDPISSTTTPTFASVVALADSGYMAVQGTNGYFDLKGGSYDFTNAFVQLRDAVIVGTTLIVTDSIGRVIYLTIA